MEREKERGDDHHGEGKRGRGASCPSVSRALVKRKRTDWLTETEDDDAPASATVLESRTNEA